MFETAHGKERKGEFKDQWLLAVTSDPAAKGSAKDLKVVGAGPVHCHFSLPPFFFTMCSFKRCHISTHGDQLTANHTLCFSEFLDELQLEALRTLCILCHCQFSFHYMYTYMHLAIGARGHKRSRYQ